MQSEEGTPILAIDLCLLIAAGIESLVVIESYLQNVHLCSLFSSTTDIS